MTRERLQKSICYRYVTATECDKNARSHRWLWTKNKQLLNLERLECTTAREKQYNKNYLLILEKCDVQDEWQLWKCGENDPYSLWQQKSLGHWRYEYYIYYQDYVFSKKVKTLKWKQYGSNRTICSKGNIWIMIKGYYREPMSPLK